MSCSKIHTAERLRALLDGITTGTTPQIPELPWIPSDAPEVLREAIEMLEVCQGCAHCRMQQRLNADPDSCAAAVPDPSTGGSRRCRLERSFHDGSRPERVDHGFVDPKSLSPGEPYLHPIDRGVTVTMGPPPEPGFRIVPVPIEGPLRRGRQR